MMPDLPTLVFESYRLDLSREQLWRDQEIIPLTNKAFAVLRYLVEHADQRMWVGVLYALVGADRAILLYKGLCVHRSKFLVRLRSFKR